MAVGPVQLIALGFPNPDFHGEILAELEKLRESDTVRVIDALAVYKDDDGEIEGAEGLESGALLGAEAGAEGLSPLGDVDSWDVLEDIPNGSAAALILLEH